MPSTKTTAIFEACPAAISEACPTANTISVAWIGQKHLKFEKLAQCKDLTDPGGILSVLDFRDPPKGTIELFGKVTLSQAFFKPGSS
jgi:hypothetical protein